MIRWPSLYTSHTQTTRTTSSRPRLGNILRSAEAYPEDRYGIDTLILWTRLAILLPAHLLADIERVIMQYQLPLVISAWSAVLASCSLALVWSGEIWAFFTIFATASVTSLASYYWSLPAAEHYGIAIRSVFDVYRHELHEKWDGILTADLDKQDFDRLRHFILTGSAHATGDGMGVAEDARPTLSAPEGAAVRSPRWRPLALPRLRTLAIGICVLVALGSWRWVTTEEVLVAVVVQPAAAFESLEVETKTTTLYSAGNRRREFDATLNPENLVALTSMEEDELLQPADYVEVSYRPTLVFDVRQPEGTSLGTRFDSGQEVQLVFGGKADFDSDPQCQRYETEGVDRLVDALILVPPNGGGTMTVGTDTEHNLPVRCYELEGVALAGGS